MSGLHLARFGHSPVKFNKVKNSEIMRDTFTHLSQTGKTKNHRLFVQTVQGWSFQALLSIHD
jgi:hypothetical protein